MCGRATNLTQVPGRNQVTIDTQPGSLSNQM